MADKEEATAEQIDQMYEWIAVQVEQTRLGKKDNEQSIKLWLEKNKYGKAITNASKATTELTSGFVKSATAMADSTGNFGSLSGAVGGTVKSVTSLMSAMSNIVGEIPFVGGALDALGDAAISVANFAFAEVQKSFDTFQDLSEAGQMGAGGIEEMAKRMAATEMPLATYSKLLKENSTDLAFLSESALRGGKTFSTTMTAMAKDTGMPLRRLGLSVAEIGDTVVDFQVMSRRQGVLDQLSQEQIRKGTEEYAKELDLIAKITGKNRKEVQKEREEAMSDSRFRASMMDRSEAEQKQHMDALAQISDPTLKRAYMDQVSGFTNSTASITAEISGMGGAIRGAIAHIDDLGGNSTDAINIMRQQALAVTETGGVLQSYSKVVESGGGVMMNFGKLRDFAVETFKSQKDAADAQLKQMNSVGSAADALVHGMRDMQKGTSIMNALFTETDTASKAIGKFAKITTDVMQFAKDTLDGKNPGQAILDKAKNAILQDTLDVSRVMGGNIKQIGNDIAEYFGIDRDEGESEDIMADMMAQQLAQANSTANNSFGNPSAALPIQAATLAGQSMPTPKSIDYAPMIAAKAKEFAGLKSDVLADMQSVQGKTLTPERQAESRELVAMMKAVREELRKLNDKAEKQHRTSVEGNRIAGR